VADDKSKSSPDKSELVNEVMARFRIPSYEAWAMTIPDLQKKLKES
jgi:hypothetical protein